MRAPVALVAASSPSGFRYQSQGNPSIDRVQVNRFTADHRRQLHRSPGGRREFGDRSPGGKPQSTLRAHARTQPQQARAEPIPATVTSDRPDCD